MGMYHSTSAKLGYEPYVVPTRVHLHRDQLKSILLEEDRLRASDTVQQKYTAALAAAQEAIGRSPNSINASMI